VSLLVLVHVKASPQETAQAAKGYASQATKSLPAAPGRHPLVAGEEGLEPATAPRIGSPTP
jgi:hypothetical protein